MVKYGQITPLGQRGVFHGEHMGRPRREAASTDAADCGPTLHLPGQMGHVHLGNFQENMEKSWDLIPSGKHTKNIKKLLKMAQSK